jgi:hypothetical protein
MKTEYVVGLVTSPLPVIAKRQKNLPCFEKIFFAEDISLYVRIMRSGKLPSAPAFVKPRNYIDAGPLTKDPAEIIKSHHK